MFAVWRNYSFRITDISTLCFGKVEIKFRFWSWCIIAWELRDVADPSTMSWVERRSSRMSSFDSWESFKLSDWTLNLWKSYILYCTAMVSYPTQRSRSQDDSLALFLDFWPNKIFQRRSMLLSRLSSFHWISCLYINFYFVKFFNELISFDQIRSLAIWMRLALMSPPLNTSITRLPISAWRRLPLLDRWIFTDHL